MSFREALESGKFLVTAEVGPGKGTDVEHLLKDADIIKDRVHAINVTDLQSSVMRLGSMAVCHLLTDRGIDPIFQVTCRDRNRLALQSDLLSAWVLGIRNVLALTGDHPTLGDHPQAKPVFELDSVTLLEVIGKLNSGFDMAGHELKGAPDILPGAVVNPGADNEAALDLQIMKMEKKIEAGAKFFQTQGVYDLDAFEKFMKRIEGFHTKVFGGIILLKSVGMARYMNKNVAGVFVPEPLIQELKEAEDKAQASMNIAVRLIKGMKDLCQGVHIMALGWESKIPPILDEVGL
ncbi:MAG: methylenetetrahydrofolate reductase [Deltaproteobacteria bacterium]|nr:methylenetetrahydrofolate reductase [Deltaproteobacteria bacterium]MBW2073359.1 methylenetetrahydrofolate reductase [Deltaproteobacteria bacterium]RLB83218.1 MAG: 5,10-methylenetetrahydrofolate reductase [Deltaproteobacteria bacterium]